MQNGNINKVNILGLGYIGLPTAVMFASNGIDVVGVDINQNVVKTINNGKIHIVEPGLEGVVSSCVREGKLRAVLEPEEADAYIIAVPTPVMENSSEADLTFIRKAAVKLAKVLKSGDLVILESTSPVGATEQLIKWLEAERDDLKFPNGQNEIIDVNVAYCPERVLPGNVIHELVFNDRIIGGMTIACSMRAVELYEIFVKAECIIASGPRVAEMAKLTENSYRDVNIAFANELSLVCHELAIDVWELIRLANKHPRVNILKPGAGVGGHCIAVDPWFIINSAPETSKLIRTARNVNDYKPKWILKSIKSLLADYLLEFEDKKISELTVAIYGIAFKPDIDDLRESPAMSIALEFTNSFPGDVIIVEPNVNKLPNNLMAATLVDYEEAKRKANIHVFLVAHKEFEIDNIDNKNYIIDAVGLLSKKRN